jgi:hypothetical protein
MIQWLIVLMIAVVNGKMVNDAITQQSQWPTYQSAIGVRRRASGMLIGEARKVRRTRPALVGMDQRQSRGRRRSAPRLEGQSIRAMA